MAFTLFLDKYGKEWTLIDDRELKAHTFGKKPASQYFKEGASALGGIASSYTPKEPTRTPPTSLPRTPLRERDKSTHTHEESGH